jgi:RNA polymerase sigma-70 factor (ECF subfamily)
VRSYNRWTDDPTVSDRQLVDALAEGDESALEAIYDRYGTRLHAYLRRLVPDAPVEEITQDVIVRFWMTATRFDPERGSLSSYLHVVAKGKALDWNRSESARRQRQEDYRRMAVDWGARELGSDAIDIRAAVDSLSSEEQKAIWLAYYIGFTYRQVATILQLPEGTAKAHLRSALHHIHDVITFGRTTVTADTASVASEV